MEGHKLRQFNLDDNLISSFSEIRSLSSLNNLRDLSLRSKQTDNPICRNVAYFKSVMSILPFLEILDGVAVSRQIENVKPIKENEEPNKNRNVQEELKHILVEVNMNFQS